MVNGQKSLDLCGHSPDGRLPSPLTSPLLNDACSVRTDDEDEVRRKVCCLAASVIKLLINIVVDIDYYLPWIHCRVTELLMHPPV